MAEGQVMREANIDALVAYFESGIKQQGTPGRLGVELEHIIVDADMNPVSYSGEYGVRWVLEQLSADFPERAETAAGDLIGVGRAGQTVTIEPAAQLELSAGPYEGVGEVRIDFEQFQRSVAKILQPHGMRMLAVGYHPSAKAADLELIPKQRYRFMDNHFATIGDFGRCMMRGSAASQVSIDYFSSEDCIRKLRLASVLTPLISLLCDNATTFEGAPRTHNMVRTEIWQKCDPARCGTVRGLMEPGFTLRDYAEYVLDTPAIFVFDEQGEPYETEKTFGEVFADKPMAKSDVEHALSLFFNDVRLKYYIEIRPADSMPIPFVTAYAAFVKGLFYSAENLDELDSMFAGVTQADIDNAKEQLMAKGFDGTAYGRNAGDLLAQLVGLAREALAKNEVSYLGPFQQIVQMRRSLADMASKQA